MNKKLLSLLLIVVSLFMLTACQNDENKLPDLTGLNKVEALNILSGLDLTYSFSDIGTNDVTEGEFVSYENYEIGDEFESGTAIVVNFAVHINVLPDLTGLTQSEIYAVFSDMHIGVGINMMATNDVPEGEFYAYGGNYEVGDIVADDTIIPVFIATELIVVNRGVMISKYVEGKTTNKAIELSNLTSEDIDLSVYYLGIYANGSETITSEIPLTGTIPANGTFVIAASSSDEALLNMSDLTSDTLTFDGNDAIALTYYNDEIVDVVGRIGFGISGFVNRTMVRDESVLEPSATFTNANWNIYVADYIDALGTHPVSYPETFTYLQSDTLIPYDVDHPRGMALVEYVYANDGDTSTFTPGFLGDDRVRFVGIDTTETGSGTLATQATNYIRGILVPATEIYVQYDPSAGFKDTYGRHLGLVWADGVLVNYMMVLKGYSQNNYYDANETLVFENITLNQWFENAEQYAQDNLLGMWA